jgi:uncharacterized protein involved in outer membrane biogenesis
MKGVSKVLIVIAVVLVGLVLAKDAIAKAAVIAGVRTVTGLPMEIKSMNVGASSVGIKGVRVLNPAGFPEPLMVDIPEVKVAYDLGALIGGKVHLKQARLYLTEFDVVRRADGALNLQQIKGLESGKAQPKGAEAPKPGKAPDLRIDLLELKIGKVVFKDYTVNPPSVREFAVNIDERHEHITNPTVLAGLIVSRALMKTTIAQLANFDVAGLQASVKDAMKASTAQLQGLATEGAKQVEQLKTQLQTDATGAARGAVDKTGKAAQGAVNEATGALKKVFGN